MDRHLDCGGVGATHGLGHVGTVLLIDVGVAPWLDSFDVVWDLEAESRTEIPG